MWGQDTTYDNDDDVRRLRRLTGDVRDDAMMAFGTPLHLATNRIAVNAASSPSSSCCFVISPSLSLSSSSLEWRAAPPPWLQCLKSLVASYFCMFVASIIVVLSSGT